MRRGAASRRCDGQQGRADAHDQSPAQDAGETAPAGLAQLIEEKKTPKNAEKAIRIPQRKGDAQADVTDGENRQRVSHGPKTSGKKRPDDQVRRPADIGADGRGAQDQGGQAPARQKNSDNHDERNNHRRDADGNELRGRFRGAEPGSRSEAGKDSEQLKVFRTRHVWDCRGGPGRRDRRHFAPIKKSANKPKKKQSTHQDGDGHPKMDVGKNDREARRVVLSCGRSMHASALLEISGPVHNGSERTGGPVSFGDNDEAVASRAYVVTAENAVRGGAKEHTRCARRTANARRSYFYGHHFSSRR